MSHHHTHGHSHHHHHHHHHHDVGNNYNGIFLLGIGLNVIFIVVEVLYGFIANSSALLSDAGHNVGDVMGLVFAWSAFWLSKKKPTLRYSYGYKKSTILISVLNAVILFVAIAFILRDAIDKFIHPQPVGGTEVMIVAAIGVVINGLTAILFIKNQKDDLNIKGAFLHMAADALVSLAVVVAGLIIKLTGHNWIDPVMSIIIVIVILGGTWRLFIDSLNLALDGVPRHVDAQKIATTISEQQGVIKLHDLHIWALSTSENALSVHIVVNENADPNLLGNLQHLIREQFKIKHTTIQIEREDEHLHCEVCC